MKIVTTYEPVPDPNRKFDWTAVAADYEPDSNAPVGHGATSEEAVEDLMEQMLCQSRFCDSPSKYQLMNGEVIQKLCLVCLIEQVRDLVESNANLVLSKEQNTIICI